MKKVWLTPDIDRMALDIQYEIISPMPAELKMDISYEGERITSYTVNDTRNEGKCSIGIDTASFLKWAWIEKILWTPENPCLFDIAFTVFVNGKVTDKVESYFGMRKVSIENGKFLLNNRPYYQKLLLDQGYWEDSLLTAPTDEDFITDIRLSKEMGFQWSQKTSKS